MRSISLYLAALGVVACGGADPAWIGSGPGSTRPTEMKQADAGAADTGPTYRDPRAGDGACAAPNQVCAMACVDVSSDKEHCGGCGKACLGDDSMCVASRCACMGTLMDYCDGVGCMDVSQDTSNCGECGKVCDPNQFNACVQGNCVLLEE